MMYAIRPSTRFQKDLKRIQKRGYDLAFLTAVIKKLAAGEELPPKNHDHQLVGDYGGCRECHIAPDWLLVYEIDGKRVRKRRSPNMEGLSVPLAAAGFSRHLSYNGGRGCFCFSRKLTPDGIFDRELKMNDCRFCYYLNRIWDK